MFLFSFEKGIIIFSIFVVSVDLALGLLTNIEGKHTHIHTGAEK